MAAAYLYHLSSNHPFLDGNKRVATIAAYVFLDANRWSLDAAEPELETTVMQVAAGTLSKGQLTAWFRENTISSQVSAADSPGAVGEARGVSRARHARRATKPTLLQGKSARRDGAPIEQAPAHRYQQDARRRGGQDILDSFSDTIRAGRRQMAKTRFASSRHPTSVGTLCPRSLQRTPDATILIPCNPPPPRPLVAP